MLTIWANRWVNSQLTLSRGPRKLVENSRKVRHYRPLSITPPLMKAAMPQRSGLKKTGFDPRVIGQTLKQIYPWLDSSAEQYRQWTGLDKSGLTRGVAGFSQPQLTFTPPEPFGSTGWRPDNSRFNLTGEATVKVEVEQTLNAGVLDGLIDTKINDNNVRQQNMILGIAD